MRLAFAVLAIFAAVPALAQNKLDGLWKPAPIQMPDGTEIDPYNCIPMEVDGATPIKGNWYGEMEGDCFMENPTSVRGFNGTLFDVTCKGDWGSRTTRQLFMLYDDVDSKERLLIVGPEGPTVLERCAEE